MKILNRLLKCKAVGVGSALGILIALVASCARDDSHLDSKFASVGESEGHWDRFDLEKISFQEWCVRWGLVCPKPEAQARDHDTKTMTSKDEQRWRAVAELIDNAFKSGSHVAVEQQELNSARMRIFMHQIGLNTVHGDVLELLGRTGLKKIALEPSGQLRFEARKTINGQSGVVRGNSGMRWVFANEGELSISTTGQYLFSGLGFSAANSFESDVFGQLHFNETDKILWSGDALAVTHVPDGFFIRDIPVRWEKFNELKQDVLIRNATEARNIIFTSDRVIRLNATFFDTAAKHSDIFVEDEKIRSAIRQLVNALGQMEVKAPTSSSPLAHMTLQQATSVVCRIEMSGTPAIDITLARGFGVQNIFSNDKSNAQIDLYGINVKARVGLPISFALRRVDVEPTRIVIKGVPVVGEISIPISGGKKVAGKELKKFDCSER